MALKTKHLLGIEPLRADDIELILQTARTFQEVQRRPIKKLATLRGKTLVLAFLEPSTRTRVSFEMAAQRLGADVVNLATGGSSVQKGESLLDTIKTLAAMRPHAIVIRHAGSGVPHWLARHTPGFMGAEVPIINAGDGIHEHPTQALLDALTITDHKSTLRGLKVAIMGDILHSRVARSNIHLLTKMGASIALAGPPPLVPTRLELLAPTGGQTPAGLPNHPVVRVHHRLEPALEDADVVMMLRVQLERQGEPLFSSAREYARHYCLTPARLARAKPDAIVMHPGPFIRGVDISGEVADSPRSVIPQQVDNGVAVRMALLYLFMPPPAEALPAESAARAEAVPVPTDARKGAATRPGKPRTEMVRGEKR
ncbi:MAG: aspartate carbamoyltransferase catalytic subunit [Terriglobia bacterium]